MEQSLLIELIFTLSHAEREQILQFSEISSFNNGKMRTQVRPLLEICLNYRRDAETRLEKKDVFARLFPGHVFVEGRLEKIMVEAHKVVRTFLTVQYYLREENEFHQTFDFSKVLRKRSLEGRYRQVLSKLQKIQEEIHRENEDNFYRQFLLEYAIHQEESFHNQVKGDLNVPKTIDALELHGHLNRLALLNRFLLQQKVAKLEVPETIMAILEENNVPVRYLNASAIIKINFEIFGLLRKSLITDSDVRALFSLLILCEKDLDPESIREFYTYLRNLCVIVFNTDAQNEEINFTLHEIYKDNLRRGYLHYKGRLHSGTYLAVSNNAVWIKNYDWALAFIEDNKLDIIDENETHDFYRLNMANYLFGVGRFSECLDYIPASSPAVGYLLQGKRLEIKALYELQSELFSYKLDNFKMFLIRTSPKLLSESQKQIHVDFANLLTQIANSLPGDPTRSDRLIKRIQEKKQAADWRWLIEKAKALKLS